jgi:hypothetical protein
VLGWEITASSFFDFLIPSRRYLGWDLWGLGRRPSHRHLHTTDFKSLIILSLKSLSSSLRPLFSPNRQYDDCKNYGQSEQQKPVGEIQE